MITCPECGQQANDDTRFCDRCGHGFTSSSARSAATSISPLAPDIELKGGYRIIALLSSTAHENRYRALRMHDSEPVQLREQSGPVAQVGEAPVSSETDRTPSGEDPAGPRAKTAELRLEPSTDRSSTNGTITQTPRSEPANDATQPQTEEAAAEILPTVQEGDAGHANAAEGANKGGVQLSTELIKETPSLNPTSMEENPSTAVSSPEEVNFTPHNGRSPEGAAENSRTNNDDLGDVFGRVLALSMTLKHPAFQRAVAGFADRGRVYLVYPDEEVRPLSSRPGGLRMEEGEALHIALQVCQAISFVHRRGLRVNDICPESVAYGADGRIKLTGLDYLSNDNELQSEPIFNDGYTAPEIYRGKKADKRADIFSIGALLYTCITGERLDSETWREEAGPIHFYPPHVVTPALELALRRALQFDPAARWPNVEALKAELVKLAARLQLRADALTDVGRVREHNEDSVLAFECKRDSLINPAQTFLYVVADGMGGAEAGEVASAIAVETIRTYVEDKMALSGAADIRLILQEALEQANSKIIEYQREHPEARNMGSTAVAALVNPPEAAIAWVGDSRAYICDDQGLRQLSKDHSLVQRLIEIGQITQEEARHHEHKNVITRSLGARPTGPAGAESLSMRLKRGDRLLLCSDGLTAHVEDRQINELLRRHFDPTAAARELVVAANAGGGTDNVSVVVIVVG
ncbi:MAG: Stp1/IreP family PP2C-type Ser/Thr phosphatase [Deltaproteobacteria bacterium]|nr:Stp1/IreP family PP2C-type Ser/Thr phosphatase [Deltaproteobacteria bacterium]